MAKQDLRTVATNATYPTAETMNPLLCYEVWYEDDKGNRQMVAAYWDVITAWKVAEAINASVYGNLGVAEIAVASGMEVYVLTNQQQPRTDVLDEEGMRSQPNYNDRPQPEQESDYSMGSHSLPCPRCNSINAVLQIIPANMRHPEPTESYRLECGHVVI